MRWPTVATRRKSSLRTSRSSDEMLRWRLEAFVTRRWCDGNDRAVAITLTKKGSDEVKTFTVSDLSAVDRATQ